MRRFLPAGARPRQMMVAVVLGSLASAPSRAAAAAPGSAPAAKAVTDITRYCQTCWRNARLPADRWQDCTQEVFVRLLERVEADKWGGLLADDESAERREFLRAVDAVKKRTQRARKFVGLTPDLAERRPANTARDDREAVAKAAAELLSPRQRRLLDLAADGWTVPEIAAELSTTPERVSDEKYKAVKKLQHYFAA